MGKKRIVTAETGEALHPAQSLEAAAGSKKKLTHGILHIQVTYNNTKITLADPQGRVMFWSSAGAAGFSGTKKGTPFAAGRVAELVADKAAAAGLLEAAVKISGVGPGRDASLRALSGRGIVFSALQDITPIPFNGPKPKKPRRV